MCDMWLLNMSLLHINLIIVVHVNYILQRLVTTVVAAALVVLLDH